MAPDSLPAANRQVLLISRPAGIPSAENFRIITVPRAEPPEERFLVRNVYLSIDPAQRGWASPETNYSEPVPIGHPMRSLAVGVVVASRSARVPEGTWLYGWFDWQDYCVASPAQVLRRVDPSVLPLSAGASVLGIGGLTAFLALTKIGVPKAGEMVLVSTAAGTVGSLVGQIARNLGCRTVGLTGSDSKVALCRERFGYDAAFNYRTADLGGALADACPNGVDVFFDNTGGHTLDIALKRMAKGGRIVQCGTAATADWTTSPTGPRVEREILVRRLRWGGFVIFDHIREFEQAATQLTHWVTAGTIVYDEEILVGIEHAPSSISDLYAGSNRGKRLIKID